MHRNIVVFLYVIWFDKSSILFLFSIRVFFFLRTLITQGTAQEGRGLYCIPLYHLHPLTDIQAFICNFEREMTILCKIFNRNACIYQTATRGELPPHQITIWFIDDVMLIFVCLLGDLILGYVTAIRHENPVDSNSHQLSSLYYKGTH